MIPVVDKHDKVVGYKERSDLTAGDTWRISSIWVMNSRGQSLIAQRHPNKPINPNKWGPAAAGTVEKGETYTLNARKELAEEIGVERAKLTPIKKVFYHEPYGDTYRWCQTYKAILDWPIERFKVQGEEVQQLRWVDTNELLEDTKRKPDKYVASAQQWPVIFDL